MGEMIDADKPSFPRPLPPDAEIGRAAISGAFPEGAALQWSRPGVQLGPKGVGTSSLGDDWIAVTIHVEVDPHSDWRAHDFSKLSAAVSRLAKTLGYTHKKSGRPAA